MRHRTSLIEHQNLILSGVEIGIASSSFKGARCAFDPRLQPQSSNLARDDPAFHSACILISAPRFRINPALTVRPCLSFRVIPAARRRKFSVRSLRNKIWPGSDLGNKTSERAAENWTWRRCLFTQPFEIRVRYGGNKLPAFLLVSPDPHLTTYQRRTLRL